MVRGIAVAPGGVMELVELGETDSAQLKAVQRILGGYMEMVRVPNAPVLMLVNEDGLAQHLPSNLVASILSGGLPIVGPVVLAGQEDAHGAMQSIPEAWVKALADRLVIREQQFNPQTGGTQPAKDFTPGGNNA